MNGLSPWAIAAISGLKDHVSETIYSKPAGNFKFEVCCTNDSVWIITYWPKGGRAAFRAAFAPGTSLHLEKAVENEQCLVLQLSSDLGKHKINISIDEQDSFPVLRYTTSIIPKKDILISFWPRDIIIYGKSGDTENIKGKIYASQEGTRSGFIYASINKPEAGSMLYLQNLTALADYCEQTETSCANVVGGTWPELGFALPASNDKPLQAGKETCIADAFVAFDTEVPVHEAAMTKQYLNLLAAVYLHLPKPDTHYQQWPDILNKGLKDLIENPGCWSQVAGHQYFNAYVSDYATPPEIMVQLAVLLPLQDYVDWSGKKMEIIETIKEGLESFYDDKIGSVMRWLPSAEDQLEGEEEQKEPKVMDSWYLHHPLLNLSRLALKGDHTVKKLFLDSLDFAIKIAHHFQYEWPVFYKMDTLEVVKAETSPGKGGEKDVPGLYAHIMLQAWELTKEKRYLNEAEKAAKKLKGLGFELFYQANNTAFSSGALLRLWKITKNQLYLDLSYLCLANIFRNVQLWDCNYGYGKHFPTFFALFPLKDAPYTAVYEEQEVFCAFHDYLKHAEGEDILPSVRLLITEYIRYLVDRAVYYYPPMLPEEMLEEKPKIGELDDNLWIALEDLHDGWEKSGSVGQEVYGAGNAFGILPRHYHQIPGTKFMLYVDYPVSDFKVQKGKRASFKVSGDEKLNCRMMIVKTERDKLPELLVTDEKQKDQVKGKSVKNGNMEYILRGNQQIRISWK